jgi:hypothetical protein
MFNNKNTGIFKNFQTFKYFKLSSKKTKNLPKKYIDSQKFSN